MMAPAHFYLLGAIICEVVGTSALQVSQQFTKPGPTALLIVSYAAAFYLMSFALRTMPVGVVYAIWSGLGIVLISLAGLVLFGQRLDVPAVIGLGLIVAGVVVVNLFSKTAGH